MKGVIGGSFLLVFAAFPFFARAQVVINEVMYNPSGSDSGREWVELYNQGASDVALVGGTVKGSWRIADSSNHTLTDPAGGTGRGSLVVPSGGYLIIASDPTEFISGEYVNGSYAVVKSSLSLNNTGATVSLIDGTGSTVDSVTYANTQGGSDDGSSLQRQSDGSWLAAQPTPGALNSTIAFVSTDSSTGSQNTSTSSSSSSNAQSQTTAQAPESSYVAPPTPDLYADAGADRIVIVGADSEFDARAYDKTQDLLDAANVRFLWNFGDGQTAEGPAVLHHYDYPGKYALVLNAAQDKNAAIDEATVTAEPAKLSFTALQDGGAEIDNLAGRDLDLSNWFVSAGAGLLPSRFMLPPHSTILAGSSMRIARTTLGFSATGQAELEYPNGTAALQAGQTTQQNPVATSSPPVPTPAPVVRASSDVPAPTIAAAAIPVPAESDVTTPDATDTAATSETAAAAGAPNSSKLWWFAAFGLAAAAALALVAAKKLGKGEWDIVEEK